MLLREVYETEDVGRFLLLRAETNPGRDGFHVHALWCGCKSKSRRDLWQKWCARYVCNRMEPVNCAMDISDYCAKCATKEGAWFGLKLLAHRHPALKDLNWCPPLCSTPTQTNDAQNSEALPWRLDVGVVGCLGRKGSNRN